MAPLQQRCALWPTETAPQLTATVVYTGEGWAVKLDTRRLLVVEMQPPCITILRGSETVEPVPDWIHRDDEAWEHRHLQRPIFIAETSEETSVVIVWRGELWPKFNVTWHGASPLAASETLGNKMMLRLFYDVAIREAVRADNPAKRIKVRKHS